MKVLVTGGTGFLGRVLVRMILEQKDWTVRLLVRDTRKVRGLDPSRIEIVRGNMRDEGCLRAAVDGVDQVFHVAAAMSGTWNDYYQETVVGTERLVRLSLQAGVGRFIYVSSLGVSEVSGHHEVIDEETGYESRYVTDYTKSKILAEGVVRSAVEEQGLDAVIVRPGVIFGPGGPIVLPRIGYRFGSMIVPVGWRDIPIPTVFVEHAAAALLLVAEKGKRGGVYHLLDDEPVRKSQYLRMLKQHWNPRLRTVRIPYPVAHGVHIATGWLGRAHPLFLKIHRLFPMLHLATCARTIRYSNGKLKELGWRQTTPLDAALERTVQSYPH
jgi:nucleoside-diphosphate-sugar epimerase